MQTISVMVIEGRRLSRDGMVALLRKQPDIRVVAAVETAEGGLPELRATLPHVVLMAAELGKDTDEQSAARVRAASPEARLILTNVEPAHLELVPLIKVGVAGFLLRTATPAEVIEAIHSVMAGGRVLPPPLTGDLFAHLARQRSRQPSLGGDGSIHMTKREQEVIYLIAEGASNKEIAQRLNVATLTVKTHVHTILKKLALHSRLQLAAYTHGVQPHEPALGMRPFTPVHAVHS